jgi:hypothetical protein
MSSPFRDLHRKNRENFITNAIWAIGNFLIYEERLLKLSDSWSKELISLVFFIRQNKNQYGYSNFQGK